MKKGFTILEFMIYSAILGIFLMVLTTLFTSTLDLQLESEANTDVTSDSRYIFSRLSYDMGRSSDIIIPATLGEETSTMQLVIDGNSYTYAINNGVLEVTSGVDTDRLHSTGSVISDIHFLRLGNEEGKHSLRIRFTVTSVSDLPSGPKEQEYQTTITLR